MIYKLTLFEQLNQDPNLSHSGLTRVRWRQKYQTVEETVVSLFDDYAVLDRSKSGYLVGNLVCLTYNGFRECQDYERPVSYQS